MSLITVSFAKPVTFTSNAGVTIKNETTTEVATINSPASGTNQSYIQYNVTWISPPARTDLVTWSYDPTAVGSDYSMQGIELEAQSIEITPCPRPVAYDYFNPMVAGEQENLITNSYRLSDSAHSYYSAFASQTLKTECFGGRIFKSSIVEECAVMDLSALANRPTRVETNIHIYQTTKAYHGAGVVLRYSDDGGNTMSGIAVALLYNQYTGLAYISILQANAASGFTEVDASATVAVGVINDYEQGPFALIVTDNPSTGVIDVTCSLDPALTHSYDPLGFKAAQKDAGIYVFSTASWAQYFSMLKIYDD